MTGARLVLGMAGIAILGGIVGALAVFALLDSGSDDVSRERGTVVTIAGEADQLFVTPDLDMWCNDFHRFCIPRFEDPHDAHAFYLGDTHDYFRQEGCFVDWRPDFDLSNFGELTDEQREGGAFRGGCSGSTFLPDGTRVFGPSPRNLDEFPVQVVTRTEGGREATFLEVDTTHLICGEWSADYPPGEQPAAVCELAPPFD
ncbi:MAG: hypothetical protein KC461_06520 [Dehalococcoidia bacterium]|nr:hypothetical protein [Dehalococcoidia bacterium]